MSSNTRRHRIALVAVYTIGLLVPILFFFDLSLLLAFTCIGLTFILGMVIIWGDPEESKKKGKAMEHAQPTIIHEWNIVAAELSEGTMSVGVRFNREETVHFFMMHLDPDTAAEIIAELAQAKTLPLSALMSYEWTDMQLPPEVKR